MVTPRGVAHTRTMAAAEPRSGPEPDRTAPGRARSARFGTLPERVRPDQFVETKPVSEAPDPQGGRDSESLWLIHYGAG